MRQSYIRYTLMKLMNVDNKNKFQNQSQSLAVEPKRATRATMAEAEATEKDPEEDTLVEIKTSDVQTPGSKTTLTSYAESEFLTAIKAAMRMLQVPGVTAELSSVPINHPGGRSDFLTTSPIRNIIQRAKYT